MIELEVTTDNQSGIAGMISGLTSQLPYAYSVALNNTVNAAQSAIQASLGRDFTLRRADFITRTIYIAPSDRATKANLVATVRVNPERNFLGKFEDGGTKSPQSAGSLAVPIIRATNKGLIIQRGDPLSVKMLMASINAGHGKVFKTRRSKGGLRVTTDPNRVYLVTDAKGTFIIQRTGPNPHDTRVLYAFKHQVPIPASLHFEEIAMTTALAKWDENFAAAIDYAMATAR